MIIITKERSGSATVTTHSQPQCQEEEKKDKNQYVQNIFQHIKMSKAFTLEKSQKNAFCLWHVRLFILLFMAYAEPVYNLFRTPTLPYRAQPLLYATGKMSLNWELDCSSICSMHALAVNCLPSFGRAIGWTVKYEWRKLKQVIMSFFRESNTCIWNNDVTLYFFGSVKGFLLIS